MHGRGRCLCCGSVSCMKQGIGVGRDGRGVPVVAVLADHPVLCGRCVSLLVECEAVGTTNAEVLVQLVDASGAEDRSVTGQSTGSLGQGSCWLR